MTVSRPGRTALAGLWLALFAAAPAAACPGDCNGDDQVAINELIGGVNIALGTSALDGCARADADGDGLVDIADLIGAVRAALEGCPSAPRLDAIGGATLGLARGLSGIASAFQSVISTVNAVSGRNDPNATVHECPAAGSYVLDCRDLGGFRVRNRFTWDGCRYTAADGSLTLSGVIEGTSLGVCPSLLLPPIALTIGFTIAFEDAAGGHRTVEIDATGSIANVALEERPCPVKGGEATFTGTIRTTTDAAGEERVTLDQTRLAIRLSDFFGDNCQPGTVSVTVDGPVELLDSRAEPPLMLAAQLAGMQAVFRDGDAGGTSTVSGALSSPCLGGDVTLATLEPIGGGLAAECPSHGTLDATVGDAVVRIAYRDDGSVDIDAGADGTADDLLASCLASDLRTCMP